MYACISMQDLGGSGGMAPPGNFRKCSEIASEAILGQSRAVVATWLAEYFIQFLAIHVCIC